MIRRAEPGDEAIWQSAVRQLIPEADRDAQLATQGDIADALRDDRCYLFLALHDSVPVGLLNAYRFPDVEAGGHLVYLYNIEVSIVHRGRGIGSGLIRALIGQCRKDGVRKIWAGTDKPNQAAQRAFQATKAELMGGQYLEYEWDLD